MLEKFGIFKGPEMLEGTFAFWAYDTRTKNLFLVRNSCTLYANCITGEFSSTEFEGSTALDEGKLYSVDFNQSSKAVNCIAEFYQYKFNSPYFIL